MSDADPTRKPIFGAFEEGAANHPRLIGRPSRSINDDEYREAARIDGGVDDAHPSTEPGAPVPVMRRNAVPPQDLPARVRMHKELGDSAEPLPTHAINEIKPTAAKPVPGAFPGAAEAQAPVIETPRKGIAV